MYAVSVQHSAALPELRDRVPYVVALVELAEGARMMSNAPKASGDSGTSQPPAIAASSGSSPATILSYAIVNEGQTLKRFAAAAISANISSIGNDWSGCSCLFLKSRK